MNSGCGRWREYVRARVWSLLRIGCCDDNVPEGHKGRGTQELLDLPLGRVFHDR